MHVAICPSVFLGDSCDIGDDGPVTHLVVVGREPTDTVQSRVFEVPVDNESDSPIYIYFGKVRTFIESALGEKGSVLVFSPDDSRRTTVRGS